MCHDLLQRRIVFRDEKFLFTSLLIIVANLPMTRTILAVQGKPFVSPRADDASWRSTGPVPSATESPTATRLASEPWPAPSIGRPACVPCLNVWNERLNRSCC